MKLRGQKIEGLNVETIYIPRGDNEPIVFKAKAIPSLEEFEALCPPPKGRTIIKKGGVKEIDTEDKSYQKSVQEYNELRIAFIVTRSLLETEDFSWETVDLDDPQTWKNYLEEFKDAGLSDMEKVRIMQGVMSANGLNEAKVEAARQDFLAGRWESKNTQVSQTEEQCIMPSGELVSVSE